MSLEPRYIAVRPFALTNLRELQGTGAGSATHVKSIWSSQMLCMSKFWAAQCLFKFNCKNLIFSCYSYQILSPSCHRRRILYDAQTRNPNRHILRKKSQPNIRGVARVATLEAMARPVSGSFAAIARMAEMPAPEALHRSRSH